MLKLMLRLYDPTEGTILVNDQGIRTLKLADLSIIPRLYTLPVNGELSRPDAAYSKLSLTCAFVRNRSKTTSDLGALETHMMKPGSGRQRDWLVPKSSSTGFPKGLIRIWNDPSEISGIYLAMRIPGLRGRSTTIWFVRSLGVPGTRNRSS